MFLLIFSFVLISGCTTSCPYDCKNVRCPGAYCDNGQCKCPEIEPTEVKECTTDNDCVAGGCSGTVCQSKDAEPIFTTCEWREEYACYKEINCGCVNGKCQWKKTKEFEDCVEKVRSSFEVVV